MRPRLGCGERRTGLQFFPKQWTVGIMVSDFIEEYSGYLSLASDELDTARTLDPNFPQKARELFEYGAAREGYWTGEKFMLQLGKAFKIVEFKYNPDEFTVVWLFNQSSCHKAFASDALNVNNMNVKPGGKQAVMHDTVRAGKSQKHVDSAGVPKGMKIILEECGINTQTLKGDDMRVILANYDDFRDEKTG